MHQTINLVQKNLFYNFLILEMGKFRNLLGQKAITKNILNLLILIILTIVQGKLHLVRVNFIYFCENVSI